MMLDHRKERSASMVEVDYEVRNTDDTLDISVTPMNWTIMSNKTQFPDCLGVRYFGAMSLHKSKTSIHDRKGVRRNTDIGV